MECTCYIKYVKHLLQNFFLQYSNRVSTVLAQYLEDVNIYHVNIEFALIKITIFYHETVKLDTNNSISNTTLSLVPNVCQY